MRRYPLLRNLVFVAVGFWIMQTMSSCGSTKGMILVRGPFDTAKLSTIKPIEPIIRKGDILSIIVFSDNPEATKIYNQSLIAAGSSSSTSSEGGGVSKASTSPEAPGYEVDAEGNIVFQGIGKLKIEGLTKAALIDTLNARLRPFLQNPYYSIRFLNFKFTMMGEVMKPGEYSIPGTKVNLLEAIAMSGDLTNYADRDSVFVIRENNNKREFAWLNITKPEIIASPYYYVQQNDIIIVEPNKKKSIANDIVTTRNVSMALAFITTFALIYSLFHHY
jgi:polysaccharide export outer membrane protein